MKNTYIMVALVIIIAVAAFFVGNDRAEAPVALNEGELNPILGDGSYKLDIVASKIGWKGEFVTGASERGTIEFKSGSATIAGGVISEAHFVIDMNSVVDVEGKEMLETHLKGADFFDVNAYPEASFVLRKIEPISVYNEAATDLSRYVVSGDLTIRGITQPISFTADINSASNDLIFANASFAINRADWEIKYNSASFFKGLGDKTIRDAVEITLDLRATKE
jgi:polyisoprenoid-binding protein YceI